MKYATNIYKRFFTTFSPETNASSIVGPTVQSPANQIDLSLFTLGKEGDNQFIT